MRCLEEFFRISLFELVDGEAVEYGDQCEGDAVLFKNKNEFFVPKEPT